MTLTATLVMARRKRASQQVRIHLGAECTEVYIYNIWITVFNTSYFNVFFYLVYELINVLLLCFSGAGYCWPVMESIIGFSNCSYNNNNNVEIH